MVLGQLPAAVLARWRFAPVRRHTVTGNPLPIPTRIGYLPGGWYLNAPKVE